MFILKKKSVSDQGAAKIQGTNTFSNNCLFSANAEDISPCTEEAKWSLGSPSAEKYTGRGGQHRALGGQVKASFL